MRLSDQNRAPGEKSLESLIVPSSLQSVSTDTSDVLENSLLVVQIVSKQYVVLRPNELKALGNEHKVICYADTTTHSLNKLNGERISTLPKNGIEGFLDGMVTALNLFEQGGTEDADADSSDHQDNLKSGQIAESRDELTSDQVQAAVGKALRLVSKAMDQNIDRWVAEAADRILKSTALKSIDEIQRSKSAAMQLQGTSAELGKRFQARLIESLHKFNHPEKEQISLEGHNLSLAEDEHWHQHTAILALSSSVAGQTKLDFNQLNRRFSYLLNRRIKPEKNVVGPEMIAWCMCSALGDISYSKEQVNMLHKVVSEFFAGAMGKIYREINLLWIGMEIIPQIKLRVWQDDYQPTIK